MNWAGFLILGEACFFFGFPWPEGKKCPYNHQEGYAVADECHGTPLRFHFPYIIVLVGGEHRGLPCVYACFGGGFPYGLGTVAGQKADIVNAEFA